ncbi:MAG TPA: hypothetical protein V6D17_04705 [Candidatus Obscuribacterales bacterium]
MKLTNQAQDIKRGKATLNRSHGSSFCDDRSAAELTYASALLRFVTPLSILLQK